LRPFTLLDSRDRLRKGVFGPGHNLPTMTIDEYLEEERRRGGSSRVEGNSPRPYNSCSDGELTRPTAKDRECS
jgi:hypothetical protein